jgi:pantetheine-phosphate adenylyltransferase
MLTLFDETSSKKESSLSRKVAIFPASFDPVTNGHVDLIDRISRLSLFDEIVIAIGINIAKPPRFTLEERTKMLESVTEGYDHITIEQYSGLTAQYAQERGACAVVRGLREMSDFEYEFQMARMNHQIAPGVDTLFMMANAKYAYLSSTLVVEIFQMGSTKVSDEKLLEMVPPIVVKMLRKKFQLDSDNG